MAVMAHAAVAAVSRPQPPQAARPWPSRRRLGRRTFASAYLAVALVALPPLLRPGRGTTERPGPLQPADPLQVFFDFFGKPGGDSASTVKKEKTTATYTQQKALRSLRRNLETQARWEDYCVAANRTVDCSVAELPKEFVQAFLADPAHYDSGLLKGFCELWKLGGVEVPRNIDDDEDDFGGFMDSNSFGLVKSEKWLKAENDLLARKVQQYRDLGPEEAGRWQRYLDRQLREVVDPDDEESRAVRGEMAMRTEGARRKTALESWVDVQEGKAAPGSGGNKWGTS